MQTDVHQALICVRQNTLTTTINHYKATTHTPSQQYKHNHQTSNIISGHAETNAFCFRRKHGEIHSYWHKTLFLPMRRAPKGYATHIKNEAVTLLCLWGIHKDLARGSIRFIMKWYEHFAIALYELHLLIAPCARTEKIIEKRRGNSCLNKKYKVYLQSLSWKQSFYLKRLIPIDI